MPIRLLFFVLAGLTAAGANCSDARAGQKLYDMRVFLGNVAPAQDPRAAPEPRPPPRASEWRSALATPVESPRSERGFRLSDYVSELVAGVWSHDPGQDNNESDTWDLNAEIIFRELDLFDVDNAIARFLLTPRPLIGGSANNKNQTHTFYWALNWRYLFESEAFAAFSFGLAYHTGNLERPTRQCPPAEICHLPGNRAFDDERNEVTLGSRVLFRESLAVGYRFDRRHALSIYAAHISNGGILADDNDGMNFVGIRYGYSLE